MTLKDTVNRKDRYLIFSMQDKRYQNANRYTYVFKCSQEQGELAINLDRHGGSVLSRELVYLDINHSHCKGFKTVGLSIYHPLLQRMVRIATMEVCSTNSEVISMCFRLLNDVMADVQTDKGFEANKPFNPMGIMADEEGILKKGTEEVLDIRGRFFTCGLHFMKSAKEHSRGMNEEDKAEFIDMCRELMTRNTVTAYMAVKEKLEVFILKKNEQLRHFMKWWHTRRAHVFDAFKSGMHWAPRSNLQECDFSKFLAASGQNLSFHFCANMHCIENVNRFSNLQIPTQIMRGAISEDEVKKLRSRGLPIM